MTLQPQPLIQKTTPFLKTIRGISLLALCGIPVAVIMYYAIIGSTSDKTNVSNQNPHNQTPNAPKSSPDDKREDFNPHTQDPNIEIKAEAAKNAFAQQRSYSVIGDEIGNYKRNSLSKYKFTPDIPKKTAQSEATINL